MSDPIDRSSSRRGLRKAWPWLLLAAALALWVFESMGHGGREIPPGELAPSVSLPTDDGTFELEAHRGRVVVMAFWATWCGACRAEAPVLSRVHDRIASQGDRVVGVSVDELDVAQIRSAADRLGMRYGIARATPEAVQAFGVDLLPTIFVIGPDGRIADSFVGSAPEDTLVAAVERARDGRVSRAD